MGTHLAPPAQQNPLSLEMYNLLLSYDRRGTYLQSLDLMPQLPRASPPSSLAGVEGKQVRDLALNPTGPSHPHLVHFCPLRK